MATATAAAVVPSGKVFISPLFPQLKVAAEATAVPCSNHNTMAATAAGLCGQFYIHFHLQIQVQLFETALLLYTIQNGCGERFGTNSQDG